MLLTPSRCKSLHTICQDNAASMNEPTTAKNGGGPIRKREMENKWKTRGRCEIEREGTSLSV